MMENLTKNMMENLTKNMMENWSTGKNIHKQECNAENEVQQELWQGVWAPCWIALTIINLIYTYC